MDPEGLIDNRNIDLWNHLNSIHEIAVEIEYRNDYEVFSQKNKSIIYVPNDNITPSGFTHELLHIDLHTKKIFISEGLKLSIRNDRILSKIISNSCIDHIGNCLQHIKMLPDFVDLGFDRKEFISDYEENKLTEEETLKIKAHFYSIEGEIKVYKAKMIDLYVGKYFAVISCPNTKIHYSNRLNSLREIDLELFTLLENFSNAWISFDHKYEHPVFGRDYNSLLNDFIIAFEKWSNKKVIN